MDVNVTVNGRPFRRRIEPRLLLSDFIRHDLGLTGTHVGCESGVCGACTVLLDGLATRSCCTLAVQADGRSVETVESLGRVSNLSPLQRGFWEKHGLQCGYCTPGMLMLMTELLHEIPNPTATPFGCVSTTISAGVPAMRTSSVRSSARSS